MLFSEIFFPANLHLDFSLIGMLVILLLVLIWFWNHLLQRKVAEYAAKFNNELENHRQGEAKYRRLISSLGNDFIFLPSIPRES